MLTSYLLSRRNCVPVRRLPAWLVPFMLALLLSSAPAPLPLLSRAHAQPQPACPNLPQNPPGLDFSNKDLSGMNFSRRDLRMANFSGSTLKGTVFIGANLAGANFSGARVLASAREDLRPTDFTGANLAGACFAGMTFSGRTYFTHADISCADFSHNNLSDGLAIFGPSPLAIAADASCKPAFRGTVMHCEFVEDWPKLDFGARSGNAGADLSACGRQMAGLRFDGANLAGVNLAGANLDGISFANADLSGASLDQASLQCSAQQCASLENANLQGATLIAANLSGANLHGATLSGVDGRPAANLSFAHLRNVNLSKAQLIGTNFSGANFYGTNSGACPTTEAGHNGSTRGCASAYGATITGALFTNAYLYGVDFGTAAITGANFDGAVLIGADFSAAAIGTSSNNVRTTFFGAWLQGTNLDAAESLRDVDLGNAALDFGREGNQLYLQLPGRTYNRHACGASGCMPARTEDVCVWISYGQTTVPASNASMICPDGFPAGGSGCGRANANGSNPRWNSSQQNSVPQAWYALAATYAPAAPASVCNGRGMSAAIVNW
nr:pentapeptide repeat-containing protein [uncultured Noviherbaspirillum sp.]